MKKLFVPLILWYIRFFAKLQLKKIQPRIIGIAGSSGKTSLVELLSLTVSDYFSVRRTKGENSEIGIPLHILGISVKTNTISDWIRIIFMIPVKFLQRWEKHDIYIIEMGIDSPVEPKNMSYLLKIVRPTIGIITNVALEHSVYFDPYVKEIDETKRQEKILSLTAKQELLLLTSLPKNETAVVNIDDPEIKRAKTTISARQITISLKDKRADFFAEEVTAKLNEFTMAIRWRQKKYQLTIPQLLPAFYAYEFLFALATALSLEISISEAIASLQKHFSLPPGRLSVFQGIKKTTIIDSSYNNATLEPILGILDTIKYIERKRRKVAIIGDMRELGSQSRRSHEILAEKISKTLDSVILIGPLLKNYTAPILRRKNFPFQSFLTFSQANQAIIDTIKENDIVLIKGSQNTLFLERAVEMLLQDKKDINELCRRGEFWDKKRAETV